MAVVTRYFSTTGAGAEDGTSWANRDALFDSGNWNSTITGFDFSGADSLECRIGPGSYTCSQQLASWNWTNPPTDANPFSLVGCDSSGNLISPPDPNWASCEAAWSDSTLPAISFTATGKIFNSVDGHLIRLLKITATSNTAEVMNTTAHADWCHLICSSANSGAIMVDNAGRLSNCYISMSGTTYECAVQISSTSGTIHNCRIVGVTGTSGNRRGVATRSTGANVIRMTNSTVQGFNGYAVSMLSTSTAQDASINNCVLTNCGGGFVGSSTASQTQQMIINRCMITNHAAYGINASASNIVSVGNRLRDNTSGNYSSMDNNPTFGDYTTDSDDTEYVNHAGGDFTIDSAATIYGSGYGVKEEAGAGTTGRVKHFGGGVFA